MKSARSPFRLRNAVVLAAALTSVSAFAQTAEPVGDVDEVWDSVGSGSFRANVITAFKVSLSSNYFVEGSTLAGTITLGTPAPAGGLTFNLYSNTYKIAFPTQVTVPAGKTSAEFPVVGLPTDEPHAFWIAATFGNQVAYYNATIRSLAMQKMWVPNYTPKAGQTLVGGFSLETTALLWGKHAYFTSDNPNVSVTPDFWIAPGQQTGAFIVKVGNVPVGTKVVIYAKVGDRLSHITLTITK